MAGEQIVLDPTSEDATNTQLDITDSTLGYYLLEHDYPTPDNDEVWAYSTDTEGERRANTRPKNRVITAKVRSIQPNSGTPAIGTIVSNLQRKIGKLNREGGTYKRVLPSGDTIVFDVLAATITVPSDKQWITAKKADVTMTFTVKPYGRGAEITLTDHVESTLPVIIFTETGIKGDVPGLGRLVVDNDASSNTQRTLIWGLESRYYSAASTAALFYQGESCALLTAVTAVGPTGASGSGSNTAKGTMASPATWQNMIYVGASSTAQTHIGRFRVFARVRIPAANTGIMSLRCSWGPIGAPVLTTNDPVSITDPTGATPAEDIWVLTDLGQVAPEKAITGTQGWLGRLEAQSTVASDVIYIDWLMLIPVVEGSGEAQFGTLVNGIEVGDVAAGESAMIRNDCVRRSTSGYWTPPNSYEGDYLLVPPAGAEARTVRVIVKFTRGVLEPDLSLGDLSTDPLSARLFYTPRYLAVPAP